LGIESAWCKQLSEIIGDRDSPVSDADRCEDCAPGKLCWGHLACATQPDAALAAAIGVGWARMRRGVPVGEAVNEHSDGVAAELTERPSSRRDPDQSGASERTMRGFSNGCQSARLE